MRPIACMFGIACLGFSALAGCSIYSVDKDKDGDGFQADVDCDDTRADIYPSAPEICDDGVDQNCNGIDDPCVCTDRDGDGWCADQGDCDDGNPAVNPDQAEVMDNGLDDDCDPSTPDRFDCADADCSAEGLPGQGRDRDGDMWGDCCDCDDADPQVHPQANEILYNGKDDDCDPATSDGNDSDRDGDGYDSLAAGGTDCDDHNPNIHPGAPERCDSIDNDCDGQIDPPDCNPDGGPPDGDDDDPVCEDISGTYDIASYCLQIDDFSDVELVQDGCSFSFNMDAVYCTGTIDASMNLYVECAGLGVPCTGQASLSDSFPLVCSEQCSFIFQPADDPDECGRNADCPEGQSCQVFVSQDGLSLLPECWYGAGPGVDNTGAPCSPPTDCFSVWCEAEHNYCQGVCSSDADCPAYEDDPQGCVADLDCSLEELCLADRCLRSFECATHPFWMGFDAEGNEIYDTVQLCRPVRRACALDADCRAGEACHIWYDAAATSAGYACAPGRGAGELGADCYDGGMAACWTGLCIQADGGGPGNEYCSSACVVPEDCGDVAAWDCQAIRIDVRPGFVSYVPACIRR